jgi:hypothetical protein
MRAAVEMSATRGGVGDDLRIGFANDRRTSGKMC